MPSRITAGRAAIIISSLCAGSLLLLGSGWNRHHGNANEHEEGPVPVDEVGLTQRQLLGKKLFFDTNLSEPVGTSCASCHDPKTAFGGNNGSRIGVARGSRPDHFGFRNTPTAMYASFAPAYAVVIDEDGKPIPTGGQFLDGRVDTLAAQAQGPLLDANEMNNPSPGAVVAKVAASAYADAFRSEWGDDIFDHPVQAFAAIAQSLEEFERTPRFHPFSSAYDAWISGDHSALGKAELRGMELFFDKEKGNCAACHTAKRDSRDPRDSLFTDFTYDCLGVPRNRDIPANVDPHFFDLGLGGPQRTDGGGATAPHAGAFKVPTLRNAALRVAFMHNGRFATLREAVSFYATRDTDPARWYPGEVFDDLPPEAKANVNVTEPPYDRKRGEQPRLSETEVDDLVAFIRALTDHEFVATASAAAQ